MELQRESKMVLHKQVLNKAIMKGADIKKLEEDEIEKFKQIYGDKFNMLI
jgi:hypothetical protein